MAEKIPAEPVSTGFRELFFIDLVLAAIWLAAGIAAIYLPVLNETPLRIVITLPVILFIPGYCLMAVMFSKNNEISHIERFMLSIGLSIAVVPLMGLGLNFTPWGIRLDPIVVSITLFSLAMIVGGYYKRALLPSEKRFRIPLSAVTGGIGGVTGAREESRFDRFLNLVLILVILVTLLSAVYVIVSPKVEERFTEFYLLGANRTIDDYPDRIITGRTYPVNIGVGNQEKREVTYTIETWMVRTKFDTVTNTSGIISMDSNNHLSFTLADNTTTLVPYNLYVERTGYDRVEFLLFNETVPGFEVTGSDRINASYRNLHLWVTVEQG